MNKLRMAVVGVGALGQHHARILSQFPDVELVAVVDPREEVGKVVAERCHTRWVADYEELLDSVDAASLVVPTTEHLPVGTAFLQRGIPVLLEKPLALDAAQGRILARLAETRGTQLQVGHIERFNAATMAARPWCNSPKYIRSERLSPYPFRSMDIGVVLDLMIHDLDLVLDLVDAPVREVEAFGICVMGGHEDSVQARLKFENGCIADLTASRICPTAKRALSVWSAEGCVQVDFSKPEVIRYNPSDLLRYGQSPVERAKQPGADIAQLKRDVFGAFVKVEPIPVVPHDALTAELRSFVDCVVQGSTPVCDGATALLSMQLADEILQSVAEHQWEGHAAGAIGPFARTTQRRKLAG